MDDSDLDEDFVCDSQEESDDDKFRDGEPPRSGTPLPAQVCNSSLAESFLCTLFMCLKILCSLKQLDTTPRPAVSSFFGISSHAPLNQTAAETPTQVGTAEPLWFIFAAPLT